PISFGGLIFHGGADAAQAGRGSTGKLGRKLKQTQAINQTLRKSVIDLRWKTQTAMVTAQLGHQRIHLGCGVLQRPGDSHGSVHMPRCARRSEDLPGFKNSAKQLLMDNVAVALISLTQSVGELPQRGQRRCACHADRSYRELVNRVTGRTALRVW